MLLSSLGSKPWGKRASRGVQEGEERRISGGNRGSGIATIPRNGPILPVMPGVAVGFVPETDGPVCAVIARVEGFLALWMPSWLSVFSIKLTAVVL